jgi:hypothetical protein
VDKQGKIAFEGHPESEELEPAIEKALAEGK